MPELLTIAQSYVAAGYSVVPVRLDGSKAPAVAWKEFQATVATPAQLLSWFAKSEGSNLRGDHGIAVVHGAISGGSEVLDFDDPTAWTEFSDLCDDHGLGEILARCIQVETPTGGRHLYFRHEGEGQGNLKLARKPDGGVRIETRGEGGYTLAPGCPAACHPTGKLYRKRAGSFNEVPVFTHEERDSLIAMARACNQRAEEVSRGQVATGEAARSQPAGEDTPGNDYNARASQAEVLDLLMRHGWQEVGRRGDAIDLRRPGKSEGLSATLGYVAPGVFFPFSSNAAPFDADRAYAPFSVYGILEHGGDFAQAAKELGAKGFGKPLETATKPQFGTARSSFNKSARELPRIEIADKQLPEKSDEAISALRQANYPPTVFVKAGQLARIGTDKEGHLFVQPLTLDSLRGILARSATWWTTTAKGGDKPITPPEDVIRDILSRPELWEGIPVLDQVVTAPVLTRCGELVTTPGYLASAKLYYYQSEVLDFGDTDPTPENLERARFLLFDRLLRDFPFKDQASRAHAIALALLPLVRLRINGPTPFHLARASTAGTGKSLLVETLTGVVVPGGASASPCPGSDRDLDEEMRKRITTSLMRGSGHVWLDNIKRHLDSPSLALALSQNVWSDRALGGNVEVNLPVRCVWVGTGNNPTLSDELHRRTVFISLDADMERPELRQEFLIGDLKGFVAEHRGELIGALLTLIRAWLEAGEPLWRGKRMGSYDNWCRVIGGILECAGISGFLSNRGDNDHADPDRARWASFLSLWHKERGEEPCGVGDIAALAVETDIIAEDTVKERQKLGYRLRQHLDRVFEDRRLELAPSDKHANVARYRVIAAKGLLKRDEGSILHQNLRDFEGENQKSRQSPADQFPSQNEAFAGLAGLAGLSAPAHVEKNESFSRASAETPASPASPAKEEKKNKSIEGNGLQNGLRDFEGENQKSRQSPAKVPPGEATKLQPTDTELLGQLHGGFNSGRLRTLDPAQAELYSGYLERSLALQKEYSGTTTPWRETERGVALVAQMLALARWWASVEKDARLAEGSTLR